MDGKNRTVVIAGTPFPPEQARALATAIVTLADAAEMAADHSAGDIFADQANEAYVSDGTDLWRIGPDSRAASYDYWVNQGRKLRLALTLNGGELGDVIRAAVTA